MRKLMIGLALSVMATAASAELVLVTTGADGDSFYANPSTKTRKGNIVRIWELTDYKKSTVFDGKTIYSDQAYWQYDCTERTRQYLAANGFTGQMGTGDLIGSHSRAGEKSFVPPKTIANAMLNFACK